MPACPACSAITPVNSSFCPACGAPLVVTNLDTTPGDDLAATLPVGRAPRSSIPPTSPQDRFLPGAVLVGRYRVVGMLGRGGMGEVYRADDLKLGQPVALKFLPAGLERNPDRLSRFLNEVRTARQVTHPNVCRVYDIGEVGNQHFLSMEYIDGEDLASLLRRIGRLPEERAVQVARQICAGLAAAHEQGILHRDLKPANIMIDGRGRVRITDFGLAGLADAIGGDVGAGTPAYMAPELIGGGAATIQSDLYALGLVLYEIYTGHVTFKAETLADLRRMHQSTPPSPPSSHVQTLDPAVERVLLHCLEKEPADRPTSVLAVSAALPGGDPLAAALAAGETPSPELVAEAGKSEAMRLGIALLLAMTGLVLFVAGARWSGTQSQLAYLPLDKRPEVLIDRAQEIVKQLGYVEPVYQDPVDSAWGFFLWQSVVDEIGKADSSATRWNALRQRPDAAAFWYRQSPTPLFPDPPGGPVLTRSHVGLMNPFPETPGQVSIGLDLDGSLRRFEVNPKRFSTTEAGEPDWMPLFALAGLDPGAFTEVAPRYQRFFAPDHRRAWIGVRPDRPGVEYRIDAGSFEGRPILFNVAPTASIEALGKDPEPWKPGANLWIDNAVGPGIILLIFAVAVVMARRNLRQGRADRRGALRLATLSFALSIVTYGLGSPKLFTVFGFGEIWPILAAAVFFGLITWVWYLAAEPLGRQVWPIVFVSSSRLLGRARITWRDPVIGRSVLIGVGAGAVMSLITPLGRWVRVRVDGFPPDPTPFDWDMLRGQVEALSWISGQIFEGLITTVLVLLALVVGRFLFRRRWPAALIAVALPVLMRNPGSLPDFVVAVLGSVILLAVLLRWGIVAAAASHIVFELAFYARATDWSAWYAQGAVIALMAVVALVGYGVWAATGGRRTETSGGRARA